MTPQQTETLKRYEILKLEIKEREAELEMLKPDVMAAIPEGADGVATERGTFTLQRRRAWEYSPAVKELESELKDTKKKEEQTGVAKEGFGAAYLVYKEN